MAGWSISFHRRKLPKARRLPRCCATSKSRHRQRMSGTARHFVREQATSTVEEYAVRVYRLAFIYSGILVAATTAVVLILVKGKFFVTLTQRTNVETLTLALIVVLFAYLAIVSAPGAFGALKI